MYNKLNGYTLSREFLMNEEKSTYGPKMIQIHTSIPELIVKQAQLLAKKEYIRPADIWRRWIMSGYKDFNKTKEGKTK